MNIRTDSQMLSIHAQFISSSDQYHAFTSKIVDQTLSPSLSTLIAPAQYHWPLRSRPFLDHRIISANITSLLHTSSVKMCITTYTRSLCNTCGFLVTYNIDIARCFLTRSESCREQQEDPVVVNTKIDRSSCKKCTGASASHSQKIICDV